ncbi:Transcription factor [Sesamum alatum]|uniref:Transcription factor n=1 Tax=Sesamum alatum TaxID=300844 RepID=A0AAE1Y134_9LAMI|nr:Transcription factor [Sesamum alatum]
MVRGPSCEKIGLRKGPWSPKEDKILVAHIQRHGHANWRELPKQAALQSKLILAHKAPMFRRIPISVTSERCFSEISSGKMVVKNDKIEQSSEYFPQIDEHLWSDIEFPTDDDINYRTPQLEESNKTQFQISLPMESETNDVWYNLFTRDGEMTDLPAF